MKKEIDYEKMGAYFRLNQLKVGDTITDKLEQDLRLLTGPRIEPQPLGEITFKDGRAYTVSDSFKAVNLDGKDILVKPSGEEQ